MESTVAFILGASFLGISAVITLYMIVYPVLCMIRGEGLSGPSVLIAGVGIEGVNLVPAGEPNTPANANSKQQRSAKKIAA